MESIASSPRGSRLNRGEEDSCSPWQVTLLLRHLYTNVHQTQPCQISLLFLDFFLLRCVIKLKTLHTTTATWKRNNNAGSPHRPHQRSSVKWEPDCQSTCFIYVETMDICVWSCWYLHSSGPFIVPTWNEHPKCLSWRSQHFNIFTSEFIAFLCFVLFGADVPSNTSEAQQNI